METDSLTGQLRPTLRSECSTVSYSYAPLNQDGGVNMTTIGNYSSNELRASEISLLQPKMASLTATYEKLYGCSTTIKNSPGTDLTANILPNSTKNYRERDY